jgi:hypothetical protein
MSLRSVVIERLLHAMGIGDAAAQTRAAAPRAVILLRPLMAELDRLEPADEPGWRHLTWCAQRAIDDLVEHRRLPRRVLIDPTDDRRAVIDKLVTAWTLATSKPEHRHHRDGPPLVAGP